jgi:CTP:molybdopterin cytidylyltransferase MocA
MYENREISSTPWSEGQGRSAKATSRTADMHALEKSDCAVVPVNQPNKGGQTSAENGDGRAQMKENIGSVVCLAIHPRWEPNALEALVRFYAGGIRR